MKDDKTFWLQGYEGSCKQGAIYRSDIAAVIKLQEEHINGHVVGIIIRAKDLKKSSHNIQFIIDTGDRIATNYENKEEMLKEYDDKYGTNAFVEGKLFKEENDNVQEE